MENGQPREPALCQLYRCTSVPEASLPALGPWAPPPAERGPSLESIYRVSLTLDRCEGNKITSLKKLFDHRQLGAPQKGKKIRGPWARVQCAHWLRRPCSVPSRIPLKNCSTSCSRMSGDRATTRARGRSPTTWSLTPITAASSTSGCRRRTDSSSVGDTYNEQ